MNHLTTIDPASTLIDLLEKLGNKLTDAKTEESFYYLPYYFQKTEDGKMYIHNIEFLPEGLKEAILARRQIQTP